MQKRYTSSKQPHILKTNWRLVTACRAGLLADHRTPIGSGRFLDRARGPRGVWGLTFSSSLAFSEEGSVVHTHKGTCWGESHASDSATAATGNTLVTHPSRQENPLPCSSFTPMCFCWRNGRPGNSRIRRRIAGILYDPRIL